MSSTRWSGAGYDLPTSREEANVRDPREFCDALDIWADVFAMAQRSDDGETRARREEFHAHWVKVRLAIRKSCLLERLLYGGEKLRTRPCPVHKGQWSGVTDPACQYCGVGPTCKCNTGWLPEA